MRRRWLGIGLTSLVIAIVAVAAVGGGAFASPSAFSTITFDQCANGASPAAPGYGNCSFTTGNLDGSHNFYTEGMSTPAA